MLMKMSLGVDICKIMFDGDKMDDNAQEKLNFNNTLAFQNFNIIEDPNKYEFSNAVVWIQMQAERLEKRQ